jgi:hypothetical protein
MTTRILDYVPRLDERNRAHRVTAAPVDLLQTSRYWTAGTVLDQGQEGSCVGHGVVGEYLASPVRGTPWKYVNSSVPLSEAGHRLAVKVYNRAKEVDEWEGVAYDGTSVRAGMLAGRELGWYDGFKWAFNMGELRTALEAGPVVVGIQIFERMFHVEPNGDWIPDGPEMGGHCVVITGYSTNYYNRGPRYIGNNSWGLKWGKVGRFAIAPTNLDRVLFKAGGEAAVAVGRHL